jgi:hypothetical protein
MAGKAPARDEPRRLPRVRSPRLFPASSHQKGWQQLICSTSRPEFPHWLIGKSAQPRRESEGVTAARSLRHSGFPPDSCMPTKSVRVFKTGDILRADSKGKKALIHEASRRSCQPPRGQRSVERCVLSVSQSRAFQKVWLRSWPSHPAVVRSSVFA